MPKLDDDIDALFKLPLTEFVGARKALVARLKQNGFVSEGGRRKGVGQAISLRLDGQSTLLAAS